LTECKIRSPMRSMNVQSSFESASIIRHFPTCPHPATFSPAVTGALWQAPPLERQGLTRKDWLAAMPPSNLALKQLEVLYLLGSLHYRPLGTYLSRDFPYPAWFTDPKVTASEGPLVRFQAALMQVEERIAGRNAERRVAYLFLLPSAVPTSINI